MKRMVRMACGLAMAASLTGVVRGALPDPAKGGKDGGPIDLLILRGHCEMNFGNQPPLDAVYQKKLADQGYRVVTNVTERQPLTMEFLKQFNAVIYISPSPFLGGGYFDQVSWRSGPHLLQVRKNVELLRSYVEEGGGLFIVPTVEELGRRTVDTLQQWFKTFGLETECGEVYDPTNRYVVGYSFGTAGYPFSYGWTDQIGQHPATEGVKKLFYPQYCTRWDDNYTTIPLWPSDKAWVSLAKAMPGAGTYLLRGNIYGPHAWTEWKGFDTPSLMVARELGKGRMAVSGLSAFHLFYFTYMPVGHFAEANYNKVDGIVMDKGDGTNTSHGAVLLDNLYRWMSEGSVKAGMGGYDPEKGVKAGPEGNYYWESCVAYMWGNKDPLCTNGPARPMKVLVGAHSAASDGKGSPADWAKAAKAAGYDVVCFTEPLEKVDQAKWLDFVAACEAASDAQVKLLPGLDMESDIGDRFLVVGHTQRIRPHILTPDGKKLFWTGHMLLGMGDVLPIVAKPQWAATAREKGALPPGLYYHATGVAVATYKDGKQVDDGMFAFRSLVNSSYQPIPVAVHEVNDPAQLADAAKAGLQSYTSADTPSHAAYFFRQGIASFGGNPMRYYVSGPTGPYIDDTYLEKWNTPTWKLPLKAHGSAPIAEIKFVDQYGDYRRFTPNAPTADVSCFGDLSCQRWMVAEVTDANGAKAFSSGIRNLPVRATIRCMDRQNLFVPRIGYTFTIYPAKASSGGSSISVPGVPLKNVYVPKYNQVFLNEDFWVYEEACDSTSDFGGHQGDNGPIWHDMPIAEYSAWTRHYRLIAPETYGWYYRAGITLKKDLTPVGNVWPIVTYVPPCAPYEYNDASGKLMTGTLGSNDVVDLPFGGIAHALLAMAPLRVNGRGEVGFATDGKPAKAGATYETAWMQGVNSANRDQLGYSGKAPFKFELENGKMDRAGMYIDFTGEGGAVWGKLKGAMVAWGRRPLRVTNANPRWPMLHLCNGKPGAVGYLDGGACSVMIIVDDREFFLGNSMWATDANLNMALATPWTDKGVTIEVNNPTDKEIKATIKSAKGLPAAYKPVMQEVTVPAGRSVMVEAK